MSQPIKTPPGYHVESNFTFEARRGRQPQQGPTRRYDWRHWAHQDRTLWLMLAISAVPFGYLFFFA